MLRAAKSFSAASSSTSSSVMAATRRRIVVWSRTVDSSQNVSASRRAFSSESNAEVAPKQQSPAPAAQRQQLAPVTAKDIKSDTDYCVDSVKQNDHDAHVCIQFLPRSARVSVYAIYAFNIEMWNLSHSTAEEDQKLSRMRLLWWRESLDNIARQTPPRHPIGRLLSLAIRRFRLDVNDIQSLVDARLAPRPPSLEDFSWNVTTRSLLKLTLQCVPAGNSENARTAVTHVADSVGVASILRSLPSQQGPIGELLPNDILSKHDMDGALPGFDDVNREKMKNAVLDIASIAKAHVVEARELRGKISRHAVPAMYPVLLSDAYLNTLESADFDVYDQRVAKFEQRNLSNVALLWKNHLRRRY